MAFVEISDWVGKGGVGGGGGGGGGGGRLWMSPGDT